MSQQAIQSADTKDLSASNPSHSQDVTNGQLLRWMLRFVLPVKKLALFACLLVLILNVIESVTVNLAGATINHLNLMGDHENPNAEKQGIFRWFFSLGNSDAEKLRWLITFQVLLIVAMTAFRYIKEVSNSRFSMTMVYYIREAVYDKLQRVGFRFHDSISSGQLINRSLSDLQNVRGFVQTSLLTTLDIVSAVCLYIVLILTKSPWLALLALVPLPLWTIYILRFSKKVQPAAKAVLEAEDKALQIITENIAGVHVIKAFATEKQEVEKFNTAADTFLQRIRKRIRLFANFQPVVRLIASVSHLSLFFLAGSLIIYGKSQGKKTLGVGDLMILGNAMGAILGRLQQVAAINEQYQNAIVSARRLWEVLHAKPTVPEKEKPACLPKKGTGSVTFENVSFGYDPSKPVLHDVSFNVPGGQIVAVVGPTGAGKSTMVSLISRFYDPHRGRILLDGNDLRDLKLSDLRTQISFVFQETYLFSDTVSANIAYGRPGLSQGEIESAARLAQAHEFIEQLPRQYDTMLGERGTNLSGGQRQRLAIARAIVTNPRVLILDDATAAVDPETEDLIRRGMRLTLYGRTTFIIAHRISTVKSADLVLVVENGRITQMGTHAELMQQEGHYREIAMAQLSGDDSTTDSENQPSHMDRLRDPKTFEQAKGKGSTKEEQEEPEAAP